MVLKRKISFLWQLFLPIALALCVVFGLIIWYQYKREADYRMETLNEELARIDNRIIAAYERNANLRPFLAFIQQFFEGSKVEGVRVSVYQKKGYTERLLYSLGLPIPYNLDEINFEKKVTDDDAVDYGFGSDEDDKMYFYSSAGSSDGKIVVRTAMPYNERIHDELEIDSTVWIAMAVCFLFTLLVTYFSLRRLTRSVTLLKDFAYRATSGGYFTGLDKFPSNELGDISREIVTLYRQRGNAIETIKKERKVAIHAIEEKARVTRQMTQNINHEIKTPVGIIRGYLESILNDPNMDDDTRNRFLERMLQNVERLSALLNDVSTMTRLENGSDKISVEMVDMHDLVYQIDNDTPVNNLAGNMSFSFDVPIGCCVTGNYGLIYGMVCGLIRNAAMHSGGSNISLRLISESDRYYVFSFYDDGTGVGEEHLPHLFERFYRVDTGRSRKMGGTGLGLPIVKSTVTSMGGTISVHNRSTGGLEFIFTLPKYIDDDEFIDNDETPQSV